LAKIRLDRCTVPAAIRFFADSCATDSSDQVGRVKLWSRHMPPRLPGFKEDVYRKSMNISPPQKMTWPVTVRR
jgi:hypothetical protein